MQKDIIGLLGLRIAGLSVEVAETQAALNKSNQENEVLRNENKDLKAEIKDLCAEISNESEGLEDAEK